MPTDEPAGAAVEIGLRRYLSPRGEWAMTGILLAGICIFFSWFIVHFGRWQYGSWDYNTLVDTGWRQVLGQRPYVDFPTTTPPGFNLGIKLAYALFGASWNGMLYFTALFACLTFLWTYWLMRRLSIHRLAAICVSFAIQCATMLTCCYWWFNNSTLILAAIYFLSCLAYARKETSRGAQASYLISLAILSLLKPNIAGVTIIAGILLLTAIAENRKRLLGLTLGAAGIGMTVLLINHVSIPALLASYSGVARGRLGSGIRYGFKSMSLSSQHSARDWIAVLSIPLLGVFPRAVKQFRERDWRSLAIGLFCLFSLFVAIYGIETNSDFPELECTVILAAGAVLTFGLRWNGWLIRAAFLVVLAMIIRRDLTIGSERLRVMGIGPPHMFFELQNNEQRIASGYLKDMRVSTTMIEVEREVEQAKASSSGPYFFGPRLEFNYAQLRLPSPEHSPILWDPGAAFPESGQEELMGVWERHQFGTLMFLNDSSPLFPTSGVYTFYSQAFRDLIDREYVKDTSNSDITVYHRREAGGSTM